VQIWGITTEQASEAMYNANEHYPGLIFNREPEQYGRAVRLTLKMASLDSDGAVGAAFWNGEESYSGRRGRYASWHAHGAFMAEVFNLNREARIKSAGGDIRGVSEFLDHYPDGVVYVNKPIVQS
jgi:hypothetical protein